MKTKTLLLAVAIVFGTTAGFSNNLKKHDSNINAPHGAEVPDTFKKQLSDVLTNYLNLKDALVKSDEDKAGEAAESALKSLKKVDMMLLKGDAHNTWMKQQAIIKSNLSGIVSMDGIEMKRTHFRLLSDALTDAVKTFEVNFETPVYVEFCPMANNNKGAYWLSESKDIKNPYFGDKMLKCGSVKEVLN